MWGVVVAMVVVCNFNASPEAGAIIARRSEKARAALHALPEAGRLAAILDSRSLHGAMFAGLAPPDWPDAAGTWRGTPGSSIVAAPRAVFLARRLPGLRYRDTCLPADQVAPAMAGLEADLHALWQDRPGRDDPWRDAAYAGLAGLTARFFAIHPFLDGNGHVWRLILPVLAARLGLEAREGWSVHRRPHGAEFSLALQWHGDHPSILAAELRRWFRPEPP
jgi:hypothetical protein